jgi:hypothetical protein
VNGVNFVAAARFYFIYSEKFNQTAGCGVGFGKSFQVD